MARINNLTNFLTDVASAIKEKKGDSTNIPAEEFDIEILALSGGGNYQTKTLNITSNGTQIVTPDQDYDAIEQLTITTNVPIASLQSKSYTFTTNQTMTLSPDTGYDGFSSVEVTVNVPSGSGDVKLFETVEQMNADTSAQEDDLAVVYNHVDEPITSNSTFMEVVFPSTVTLDTAITSSFSATIEPITSATILNRFQVSLSATSFKIYKSFHGSTTATEYTSSDGIVYTRTSSNENYTFDSEMRFSGTWKNEYGEFIKLSFIKDFEGFFQCESNTEALPNGYKSADYYTPDLTMEKIIVKDLDIDYDYLTSLIDTNVYDRNGFQSYPKIIVDWEEEYDSENDISYIQAKKWYCIYGSSNISSYWHNLYLNNNHIRYTPGVKITSDKDKAGIPFITFDNDTYTYVDKVNTDVSNVSFYGTSSELLSLEQTDMPYDSSKGIILYYDHIISGQSSSKYHLGNENYAVEFDGRLLNGNGYTEAYYNNLNFMAYDIVDTQLTATADYVYKRIFYGANGVETGNLQNTVLTTKEQLNIDMSIWNKFNNVNILSIADLSRCFYENEDIITLPLLDTSNVTNMFYMFQGCTNLTSVPLLNTSSVTNMTHMFYGCSSLTVIPVLDTSNVTDMAGMFYGCTSIISIPLLDTSYVRGMTEMFRNCTSLVTIPLLNTNNTIYMQSMVNNCPNLSNESLNNILAMCKNATSYTDTKTLKYIGLSSAQATTCQGLSNYSAFTAAGWTTGY